MTQENHLITFFNVSTKKVDTSRKLRITLRKFNMKNLNYKENQLKKQKLRIKKTFTKGSKTLYRKEMKRYWNKEG